MFNLPCGHPDFTVNEKQMASDVGAQCPCERGYMYVKAHWRWITLPARPGRDAPPAPRAADYGRETRW
jgi:hypothetical protein